LIPSCNLIFAGQDLPPYKYKGSWPIETDHPIVIINFILFSPNPSFSNLHCSPPSSPRRLREFRVACRSQDNPRRTVPDGVPPGAANLGFRRSSCPRRLDRPPRRLDRPPRRLDRSVLGSSTSEFPTTARSSALVCLTRKSVNTLLATPLGTRSGFTTDRSIFAWDHSATSTRRT
jgi:hypothetical protein